MQPHPMLAPAEADPATAALTAGQPPASPEDATPEEEQEDPYAGRELPGEEREEESGDEEALEEEAQQADHTAPGQPEEPVRAPLEAESGSTTVAEPVPGFAEQRHAYWRRVLTGSADTVPDEVRARAGGVDAALTDEQGEYRLLSTINRSWAADNLGVTREEVRTGWPRLRRELAQRYRVADDERELFAALSIEEQDAPRREQLATLYEAHYRAALLGQEPPAIADEDATLIPGAYELAGEAQSRGASFRQRYLSLAREVAAGMDAFAGVEEDLIPAPRVFEAMPELVRSVDTLAEMEEGERQLVYAMAQQEYRTEHPPKGPESLFRTMQRAMRRGGAGLGLGIGQAVTHAGIASMNSLGSMLGEEWGKPLREGAAALDIRARMVQELRQLLQEEVKPLRLSEEAGLAAQLAVDAAGATPGAVVACFGGAGFAALGLAGVGEAVAAARQRAPEGSQWLQYLAGVVGGGIQASIYMGMGRVGGQLLSNSINRFARASGSGAGGYTLSSLGVLGAMGFEEAKLLFAGKAAEGASLGTQELAARLEKIASNIDWQEYGNNAQDVERNLREAAMNLPFILIASGRVALRHFRSRDAVLGEGYALRQWGIGETMREAIMKEPNIDRQSDMLRDALRGSRRWSAPGFLAEAARALRLLNTDYYQGFKDPQTVVDFLRLPSQGGLVPRPPLVPHSADNPEHVKLLSERYGTGEKVNRARLPIALQLWDEWTQKAHLVDQTSPNSLLPVLDRREHYGSAIYRQGSMLPARVQPGGFYAPLAEAERMAMLRDCVAELQDLSYQTLLYSYSLDALTHSTRGIDHMRQAGELGRLSILESVGRSVLRRATGATEDEALAELGKSVNDYFKRRRYSHFPPGWMSKVEPMYTARLDEFARSSFRAPVENAPSELLGAYRVVLGLRACASSLYELLPTVPDFQTSLARGLSPAEAYLHLLSRELGIDLSKARGVEEMLAPYGPRSTDMRSWRLKNEADYSLYKRFTGYEAESAHAEGKGPLHWRVRRPNGSYTRWHRRRSDAVNDMVANTSFMFMPFAYDRMAPLRHLRPEEGYDLNRVGKAEGWTFTGYEQLCRTALRDVGRSWIESAPYALPGFALRARHRYLYLGKHHMPQGGLMNEGGLQSPCSMQVDYSDLSSPLRLAQVRFRTYWWRQLNAGLLKPDVAGNELVKLRVISPEEWARVQDIAKPLLMPLSKDVPLKLTPPPNIQGMNQELSTHLADFSMRYFLAHLDDMPLPHSAREWFRLAPLCPLELGPRPERPRRISLKHEHELVTSLFNRLAARELRELIPAVEDMRRAEREGLLVGSNLLTGLRSAVGLNRALSQEQAWCMHFSGGEAMMAAEPAFWRLMERPLEGWNELGEHAQNALRSYVGNRCRREPDPMAVEAEARGESPDYLYSGLQNLQEVLTEYPQLHQYALAGEGLQPFVKQLVPEELAPAPRPFAEPEYDMAPVYTGGSMRMASQLGDAQPLSEEWQHDSRVLPALHLLEALRSYPGYRPYERREGIYWQGQLYGGTLGKRPAGVGETWREELPLLGLLDMFQRIDALKVNLPAGEKLESCGEELPGLDGEELDFSPLRNVTLYRDAESPTLLCRLMPGEPFAVSSVARTPYVVQSTAGFYQDSALTLKEPEMMLRSYRPLEDFRLYATRLQVDDKREYASRVCCEDTLSGLLGGNPGRGRDSLLELLMRFAEDTGFSSIMRLADPRELTSGQVRTLQLARELLLSVCGSEPEAAYARLVQLAQRVSSSESSRELVLHTLTNAAEELYRQGENFFRVVNYEERHKRKLARARELRKEKKRRKGMYYFPLRVSKEERELDRWTQEHKESFSDEDEGDFRMNEGYGDMLRPDGYSKGFYDD